MSTRFPMKARILPWLLSFLASGCGTSGLSSVSQAPTATMMADSHSTRERLDQLFTRADADHDGTLTMAEIGLGAQQFRILDRNGDGKIDRTEWHARVSTSELTQKMLPAFRPMVDELFNRLDTNHDHRLSRAELKAMFPTSTPSLETLMAHASQDGVGRDQFDAYYLAYGQGQQSAQGLVSDVVSGLMGPYLDIVSRIAFQKAFHPKRMTILDSPAKFGIAYETVSCQTSDGLTLRGWYIPAAVPTTKSMILIHGHACSRTAFVNEQATVLKALHPEYNLVVFDLRNHGESDGTVTTFGYYEGLDVKAAIDYLRSRGNTDIGVFGVSLGGATAIRGAALCPDLKLVVDDCAYATVHAALAGFIAHDGLPFSETVANATLVLAAHTLGVDVTTTEPLTQDPTIAPRPFLVIHGAADELISPDNSKINYTAAGTALYKDLWIVPGAGHAASAETDPVGYQSRLLDFVHRVM